MASISTPPDLPLIYIYYMIIIILKKTAVFRIGQIERTIIPCVWLEYLSGNKSTDLAKQQGRQRRLQYSDRALLCNAVVTDDS